VSFTLLDVLGRLTNNTRFSELAAAWNPERLSIADRLEIYGNFLWTKNHSRWRYRTWRSDRELSDAACGVPAVAAKQLFTEPATEKLQ
jgi:hypothetical protein